jgi:hypothetical protein
MLTIKGPVPAGGNHLQHGMVRTDNKAVLNPTLAGVILPHPSTISQRRAAPRSHPLKQPTLRGDITSQIGNSQAQTGTD